MQLMYPVAIISWWSLIAGKKYNLVNSDMTERT